MESKRDANILAYMHHIPAQSNFDGEYGDALKPAIVKDYNRHTGYVDRRDCITFH